MTPTSLIGDRESLVREMYEAYSRNRDEQWARKTERFGPAEAMGAALDVVLQRLSSSLSTGGFDARAEACALAFCQFGCVRAMNQRDEIVRTHSEKCDMAFRALTRAHLAGRTEGVGGDRGAFLQEVREQLQAGVDMGDAAEHLFRWLTEQHRLAHRATTPTPGMPTGEGR